MRPHLDLRSFRSGLWIYLGVLAVIAAGPAPAPAQDTTPRPTIVLIGDSIRMGYAPLVSKQLQGQAVILSHEPNGGDSANVLKNLEDWAVATKPDIIHFNCGLHDLKRSHENSTHQVEPADYEKNLRAIVERLRQSTKARVVFANTTPILDDRHAQRKADFDRLEADVARYNEIAQRVMAELGVPIHDLHGLVQASGPEQALGPDGTHFTPEGNHLLADAVTDCLKRQITLWSWKPMAKPASGPEAARAYAKAQKERDALVPSIYKTLQVADFPVPSSREDWAKRRPEVLRTVVDTLGDLPPRPSPKSARVIAREIHPEFLLERVQMPDPHGGGVPALLLLPRHRDAGTRLPAILWLHSSTPDKSQILIPNTNGGAEPLGLTYVRAGYAVFAPDAFWHGDRVGTGPSGMAETGRTEHETLHKFHLWMGRTLWGMFVRDDQIALDYLCSRPEIDTARIGATGISMGSTRSWWLAAVDERIAAVVGVACLTRYQNLIRHGELRQHGVYYFVDGLLKAFDVEGVLALIAPRPYLALTGDLDGGSPADGIIEIERVLTQVYAKLGASDAFQNVLYPEIGHEYTPEMRKAMLEWFQRWLKPVATAASR